ncbi:MAG: hypothetical protein AB8I08_21540 [Sandaracinaceae bacterium]
MSKPEEPEVKVESAPEGAHCAVHPERSALVTCPRCGSYCCIACWQGQPARCHACLLRDPGPPVPWAERDKGFGARFFGTLAGAFQPRGRAVEFTRGEWRPSLSFAALTFLPLSMLSGIVPLTHHLGFGSFQVTLLGSPDAAALALDVAQAVGLGLAIMLAKLGLLMAAFTSLARAFGPARATLPSEPGRQVMLYRAWLLPLAGSTGLLLSMILWGMSPEPSEAVLTLARLTSIAPLVLMLSSMLGVARQAYGIGPFASLLVVFLPFLAVFTMEPLLFGLLEPLLPSSEAMEQAVELGRS